MKIKIDYKQGEKKILSVVTLGARMTAIGNMTFCFTYLGFDNTFFEMTLKENALKKLTLLENQFSTDKTLANMLEQHFGSSDILEDKRKKVT